MAGRAWVLLSLCSGACALATDGANGTPDAGTAVDDPPAGDPAPFADTPVSDSDGLDVPEVFAPDAAGPDSDASEAPTPEASLPPDRATATDRAPDLSPDLPRDLAAEPAPADGSARDTVTASEAPFSCPAPMTPCGASCRELLSDPSHCGACNTACPTGMLCSEGVCRVPASCAEVLRRAPSSPDGTYLLDPDGPGLREPLALFCDMRSDGGGWTLVYKSNMANNSDRTDDGANLAALSSASVDAVAVLPRGMIARLGTTFRVLSSDGARRLYWRGVPFYTTDRHVPTGDPVEATADLARGFGPGRVAYHAMHGPCIEDVTARSQHACLARWCCGPNAGIWWNYGPWAPGSYTRATAWVR